DLTKPAAQLEALAKLEVHYPPNTVITDWSFNSPHSYLRGNMTYQDGKLTVPATGLYYIYAQLYFHSNGRVNINVNGFTVNIIQPDRSQTDFRGNQYVGGVFQLNAGDVITLSPSDWPNTLGTKIFLETKHGYFGVFMI
ncbi:unnamed protein product, partial [Porites lobata]